MMCAAPMPRQVRAIDDLRMFDPPAAVRAIFAVQPFIGADDLRVGGVADRVRRDLETVRRRRVVQRAQLGVRMELVARGVSGLSA